MIFYLLTKIIKIILKQIKKYKPKYFIINNKKNFLKNKKKFSKKKLKYLIILIQLKLIKNQILLFQQYQELQGLKPTISMISNSKKILIANKESIICGWNINKKKAKKI